MTPHEALRQRLANEIALATYGAPSEPSCLRAADAVVGVVLATAIERIEAAHDAAFKAARLCGYRLADQYLDVVVDAALGEARAALAALGASTPQGGAAHAAGVPETPQVGAQHERQASEALAALEALRSEERA